MEDSAALLAMLKAKLEPITKERDELQNLLKATREKLDAKMKRAPKKPTLKPETIDDQIADLEYTRETQSMSLSKEKEILREISQLRAQKSTLSEYAIFQAELDGLRGKRAEYTERLHKAQNEMRELRDYVRKLEVLERVRAANPGAAIAATDLRVADLKVHPDHLPRLIGNKGSNLRKIEEEAGVTLDVDYIKPKAPTGSPATGGGGAAAGGAGASSSSSSAAKEGEEGAGGEELATIRIMGLEGGILLAVSRIQSVTEQVEDNVSVAPGLLSYLLSRSGAAIKELEGTYSLRLKVDRDKGELNVRGLPASIATAKQILQALEGGKAALSVDARSLPGIMGKGGANLKTVREATGAEIDIVRDAAATAAAGAGEGMVLLNIYGTPESIAAATAHLRAIAEEVREEELTLPIPRDAVPWLVGSSGDRINAFQTATGVYARVVRGDDDAPGATSSVVLRGTPKNLEGAMPAFETLLADYHRCNRTLVINAAQARALVGPGGATIKTLRTETGAAIEVVEPGREEARDKEREEREEKRAASKEAAAATATSGGAAAGGDAAKGKKEEKGGDKAKGKDKRDKEAKPAATAAAGGAGTGAAAAKEGEEAPRRRRNRAEELGLKPGQAAVTIRSNEPEKVDKAEAAIKALVASYTEVRVSVSGPVIQALVANKGEAISAIQKDTGAVIDISREGPAPAPRSKDGDREPSKPSPGTLILSGVGDAVAAAAARVQAIVDAHQERVLILPGASVVSTIVGKSGESIRRLQAELGVELDVDKPALALRIVGPASALEAAEARMQELFAQHTRENVTMYVDPRLVPSLIGKGGENIRKLQTELGCTIHSESGSGEIRIHGPEAAVVAAQARIREVCHLDEAVDTLTVAYSALGQLIGKGGGNIRKIEETHRVAIAVDNATGLFTIRGEPAAIVAAKRALRRQTREALKVEAELSMPQDKVAALIGPKGARIRQLEAETDASVDLPRDRTTSTVTIKLRGTPLAVEKGKAVVAAIAGSKNVRVLNRPTEMIAALRARGDALTTLSSSLDIEPIALFDAEPRAAPTTAEEAADDEDASAGGEPLGLILVHGTLESKVTLASEVVDKRLASLFPDSFAVVRVPADLAEELISSAPAGASRKAAAAEAGAAGGAGAASEEGAAEEAAAPAPAANVVRLSTIRASVPGLHAAADPASGYVVLWADQSCPSPAAAIAGGKAAISDAVKSFNGRHSSVEIDAWMVPSLIGKKGSGIAQLERDTGCKVHIDRADGASASGPPSAAAFDSSKATLKIAGPSPAALAAARARVAELSTELSKRRQVIVVPQAAFGFIIGRGGANIKALQEDTGATIDLDRDRGLIAVRGASEAIVSAALEAINETIAGDDGSGFTSRPATAADMAPLPSEVVAIPGGDKDVLRQVQSNFRDIEGMSGASISVDRENSTIVVRARSEPAIVRAVSALERAIDYAVDAVESKEKEKAAKAEASTGAPAAQATSTLAARPIGFRPIGLPPPTEAELLAEAAKRGKAAKRREKKRQEDARAATGAASESAPAPAPVTAAPAPVTVKTTAAPAPAPAPARSALAHLGANPTADEIVHALFVARSAPAPAPVATKVALPTAASASLGGAAASRPAFAASALPAFGTTSAPVAHTSMLPVLGGVTPAPLSALPKPTPALASVLPFALPVGLTAPVTSLALPAGSAAAAAALALGGASHAPTSVLPGSGITLAPLVSPTAIPASLLALPGATAAQRAPTVLPGASGVKAGSAAAAAAALLANPSPLLGFATAPLVPQAAPAPKAAVHIPAPAPAPVVHAPAPVPAPAPVTTHAAWSTVGGMKTSALFAAPAPTPAPAPAPVITPLVAAPAPAPVPTPLASPLAGLAGLTIRPLAAAPAPVQPLVSTIPPAPVATPLILPIGGPVHHAPAPAPSALASLLQPAVTPLTARPVTLLPGAAPQAANSAAVAALAALSAPTKVLQLPIGASSGARPATSAASAAAVTAAPAGGAKGGKGAAAGRR